MSRYDKYGARDDRTLEDIDAGFIGFNNRLRPDQLPQGVLEVSKNGRCDRNGEWSVRLGADVKSSPLSVGTEAITLPFYLGNDTTTSITVTNTTTITISNFSGGGSATYANFPSTGYINISDCSLGGVNGVHIYAKGANDTLVVTGTGFTNGTDGTCTVVFPVLVDGAITNIYGSGTFSDPNSADNESYILLASDTQLVAVKTSTFESGQTINPTTYSIPYASGVDNSSDIEILQAFNKVILFRKSGQTALECDLSINKIDANTSADVAVTALVAGRTYKVQTVGNTTWTNIAGLSSPSQGDVFVARKSGTGTGVAREYPQFTEVPSGVYTQIEDINSPSGQTSSAADSTVTVGASYSLLSKLKVGQELTVTNTGGLSGSNFSDPLAVGDIVKVSSIDLENENFKFFANVNGSQTNKSIQLRTAIPQGLGFIHMPAPEFGILHQRRLIVPYQYDPDNSNASRNTYDELIVSDILDNNTYDKIYASFRFNAGSTDFTVGIVSFTEDSILIFNKNSIHRVSGTTNPTNAISQVLTDEIGATARKSIVQVGKNVFFLSDNGVYSLEFLDEFNLRGTQTPLSESIQATIDRINKGLSDKSVAAYFDNRYYLAVPLDSTPGADDATTNNALLVYNFLTQSWESIDQINTSPIFEYSNLVIAGKGERRGLYVVNSDGGVHLIAGNEAEFSNNTKNGFDTVITTIGGTTPNSVLIDGEMKTRMYTFNDIDRKKYNSFEIQSDSPIFGPTNYQIDFPTENIDSDTTLGTLQGYNDNVTLPAGEDIAIRGRIGNKRAYGGQFRITNKLGKPSIRAIKLSAAQTFRSTNKAE
jgi:hypothetical protein